MRPRTRRARAARQAPTTPSTRRTSACRAARVDKGRLEVQVEAAVNVIVHDCKTPLETALAPAARWKTVAEAEETAFKLRRRIANMGTINPDAAEEYEELKTPLRLPGRRSWPTCDGARRTLAKINRVIDARMKDDFVRTFEAVNKNFQEIFARAVPRRLGAPVAGGSRRFGEHRRGGVGASPAASASPR